MVTLAVRAGGRRTRAGAAWAARRTRRMRTLAEVRAGGGRREVACRDAARTLLRAFGEVRFAALARALARLLRSGAGAASFCARRARFHALRAAVDCLRARFASRLASFRRLRARFNSSLAMRTRCLATSACSRALSRGSAGTAVSLPLFFIFMPAKRERRPVSHNCPVVATATRTCRFFFHCHDFPAAPETAPQLHARAAARASLAQGAVRSAGSAE